MIPILKRLWPIVRPHRAKLVTGLLAMIPLDLIAYAVPLVIGYVVDYVYPDIMTGGSLGPLYTACLLLAAAGVIRGISIHIMVRAYWGLAESVVQDLRNTLYDKLQHLDLSFYDTARTGDLMSRVTYDIQLLRNFFAFGIEHRVRIFAITATIFALMLWQEWRLALAVYVVVPVFFTIILYYSRKMRTAVIRKQEQMGRLNARIQENVTGIRVVKAFSMEHAEIERFDRENSDMLEKDLDMSLLQVLLNPVLLLTDGVGSLIILLYGGFQVIGGTMSLGVLFAFVSYLGVMRFPMMILAFNTSMVNLATGACDRVHEILDTRDQKRYDTGTCTEPIRGRIEFDHVRFEYEVGGTVLRDLSFVIEPGERVALFGLTGAGKSSLISLIPRFYLPGYGRILIDNRDITEWDMRHLRSQIGTVMQETFLFSATIRDNIAFAKSDATQEEIEKAASHAHIHEFIVSLPHGYDTIVGEYGVGLSGGQKQRVAIARTLLQDPRLLILDDCTSSLDAVTERKIQDELRELMTGRTTILVAQRVSTLALADRIIVLEDGNISDMDSHDRLLERNRLYRTTYAAQTAGPDGPVQEAIQ